MHRVGVAKVLAYAEELVHLRVYSNRWSRPPRKLPISDLFISRSPDVEDWGSQHVIMPFQQYQRTMLKPLDFREVVDEELIEYREWVAGSSQRLQNDEIKLTRSDG